MPYYSTSHWVHISVLSRLSGTLITDCRNFSLAKIEKMGHVELKLNSKCIQLRVDQSVICATKT